jgi:hypothetical protein
MRLFSFLEMIKAYGKSIAAVASILAILDEVTRSSFPRNEVGKFVLEDPHREYAETVLKIVGNAAIILGELQLAQSAVYANRVLARWDGSGFAEVLNDRMLPILHERIMDELSSTFFMHLTPDKAALYRDALQGWEEVVSRFPSSQTDIEEMNKCVAL